MRKKNYKGRCEKVSVSKSEDVCRLYSEIQKKYLDMLEENQEIKEIQCNVLLDGLEIGEYTSDFVCKKTGNHLMVRECVEEKYLMKPMTVKLLDASRTYWLRLPNQMEALRIKNYPYQAIEEAVVNAFYHRDYMSCEPVTIEIEPYCINIMNFPGIDRSISEKTIAEGKRFVSRYYRNRRLGEFLKELDLSEGHSSGIPTIQEELEKNGSPRAEFFTDEDRRAMRIRIPIHPAFLEGNKNVVENVIENVMDISEKRIRECIPSYSRKKAARAVEIVKMISDNPKVSIDEMRTELDVTDRTIARYISELKEHEIIVRIGPDNGGLWKILLQ